MQPLRSARILFLSALVPALLAGCATNPHPIALTPATLVDAAPFGLADTAWPAPDSVSWLQRPITTASGAVEDDSIPIDWYRVEAGGGAAWLGRVDNDIRYYRFEFPGRTLSEVSVLPTDWEQCQPGGIIQLCPRSEQ